MTNFCAKCGKKNKPGIKFCTFCGGKLKTKPTPTSEALTPSAPVSAPAPPPPPPKQGSGCGTGCLVGCLIVLLVFILIFAILFGTFYYFVFLREKEPGSYFDIDSDVGKTVNCKDSLSCLEDNLKECSPAKGKTEMGDFAKVELEILGTSKGDSCVIYAKIIEINELPPGLDVVPDFLIEKMFENLSMECLVPEKIYKQGMDSVGDYIGENIYEVCKGPLFDWTEKFGINLEDID